MSSPRFMGYFDVEFPERLEFTPFLVQVSCDLSGFFKLGSEVARRQVSKRRMLQMPCDVERWEPVEFSKLRKGMTFKEHDRWSDPQFIEYDPDDDPGGTDETGRKITL